MTSSVLRKMPSAVRVGGRHTAIEGCKSLSSAFRLLLCCSSSLCSRSRYSTSAAHVTPSPAPVTLPSTSPSPSSSFHSNVTPDILSKVGRDLHRQPHHPLSLIRSRIVSYFTTAFPSPSTSFAVFDSLHPRVTTRQNFDDLLVPPTHPSRKLTDTVSVTLLTPLTLSPPGHHNPYTDSRGYTKWRGTGSDHLSLVVCCPQFYFDPTNCLRTHTSAHQTQFLRDGCERFLVFGDCYRRDEIDASHYPVFHQAEGVRVWQRTEEDVEQGRLTVEWMVNDLKSTLDGLVDHLFGPSTPRRWLDDSFPFTSPSLQVEVQFQGKWLEVLGCGIIQPAICQHFRSSFSSSSPSPSSSSSSSSPPPPVPSADVVGWAFGVGLDRLAMILFDIPDIRLFWSVDERFLGQFRPRAIPARAATVASPAASPVSSPSSFHSIRFQPFSKFPPCPKDLSFWMKDEQRTARGGGGGGGGGGQQEGTDSIDSDSAFHENDLCAVIRSVAGDWVENVRQLGEEFVHPTSGRRSRCYRVVYRSMSQSLTNEEVNEVHQRVREAVERTLKLQLR